MIGWSKKYEAGLIEVGREEREKWQAFADKNRRAYEDMFDRAMRRAARRSGRLVAKAVHD